MQTVVMGESMQAGQRHGESKGNPRGGVSKKKNLKRKGSLGHHIRGIERLLAKIGDDMTPAARRAKEKEIESCRALQRERAHRKQETDNANRYRMVKFFDRRKVERELKKIEGNTDSTSVERRALLQRDLRYTTEYPKDCKYVSLHPSGGHTETSMKQVEDMRRRIEGGHGTVDEGMAANEAQGIVGENEMRESLAEEEEEDDFFLAEEED